MKYALTVLTFGAVLFPTVALAALTPVQVNAIIVMLQAFGVNANTLATVNGILEQEVTSLPVASVQPITSPVFTGIAIEQTSETIQSTSPMPDTTTQPVDTTPVAVSLFSIDTLNGVPSLRIAADKSIDFANTVLPAGVTLGTPTYSDQTGNGLMKYKNPATGITSTYQTHYYEAPIMGVSGNVQITIKDFSGNSLTRTITAN